MSLERNASIALFSKDTEEEEEEEEEEEGERLKRFTSCKEEEEEDEDEEFATPGSSVPSSFSSFIK